MLSAAGRSSRSVDQLVFGAISKLMEHWRVEPRKLGLKTYLLLDLRRYWQSPFPHS